MSSRRVIVEPARSADEPALQRILRLSALPGWVSLSYECEPSLNAALRASGAEVEIVVARRGADGEPVGFFSRQTRSVFIDGEEKRLGYIGQLRFDPSFRYRLAVLRAGYAWWQEKMIAQAQLPWDMTSILTDNLPARRLLEAGKPGFPSYVPLCDYVTIAIATGGAAKGRKEPNITPVAPEELEAVRDFIRKIFSARQFAPSLPRNEWEALFSSGGLRAEDFLVCREERDITGVLAIWDQRGHKQTVVRDYAPVIRVARPAFNLVAPLLRLPRLPAIGEALKQGMLSFIAIRPDRCEDVLPALIRAARARAARNGLEILLMGFVAGSPELEIVRRRFPHLAYHSKLYLVCPAGTEDKANPARLRQRQVHQELAFL